MTMTINIKKRTAFIICEEEKIEGKFIGKQIKCESGAIYQNIIFKKK